MHGSAFIRRGALVTAVLLTMATAFAGSITNAGAATGDPAPWLVKGFGDAVGTPNAVEHVAAGDRLFFTRSTPSTGVELWTSDGTETGTRLVKDIAPGSGDGWPSALTVYGDKVVFFAKDGEGTRGLWWSDGTAAGTNPIDTNVDGSSSLAVLDGFVYYAAGDPDHGVELWRTNGTSKARLTDINDSTEPEIPGEEFSWDDQMMDSNPHSFAVAGSKLIFVADDTTYETKYEFGVWSWVITGDGAQVWSYSPGGTPQKLTTMPCSDEICSGDYSELVGAGDRAYFVHRRASGGGYARDLWTTTGTTGGTGRIVSDVPALQGSIGDAVPQGNRLWFQGWNGGDADGLWVASSSGATRATQSGLTSEPTVVGDLIYYHPYGVASASLWSTDGVTRTAVADVNPNSSSEHIVEMTSFRNSLYFSTNTGTGWDLWSSDGTGAGTRRILNQPSDDFVRWPEMFTGGTKQLYFFVDPDFTNTTFPQLWALDPDVTQKAPTTTSFTAPVRSTYGKGALTTVTVTSPSGTPTGTVQVREGGVAIASAPLVNGTAKVSLPAELAVGAHQLTARYAGSTTHLATTSAVRTLTVRAASALSMTLSRTAWRRGTAVTVTGTLTTTPSGTAKTGVIKVRKGTTTIKQVTLDPAKNGVVTTRLPLLPAGSHQLSLQYPGSTLVVPATSARTAVTVRR